MAGTATADDDPNFLVDDDGRLHATSGLADTEGVELDPRDFKPLTPRHAILVPKTTKADVPNTPQPAALAAPILTRLDDARNGTFSWTPVDGAKDHFREFRRMMTTPKFCWFFVGAKRVPNVNAS